MDKKSYTGQALHQRHNTIRRMIALAFFSRQQAECGALDGG